MTKKNIVVIGAGYVGLSLASLISLKHNVFCYDKDLIKVNKINKKILPIKDDEVEKIFKKRNFSLKATANPKECLNNAEIVIISTPTDYNVHTGQFDTSTIEESLKMTLDLNKKVLILIKSTIPIGYTEKLKIKFQYNRIIFSPEFLREGKAAYDNLFPSRIVVGDKSEDGVIIKDLLLSIANKKKRDIECYLTESAEAEAIKLFSNTFLAMRVSYFNELDSFCEKFNLNTQSVIEGVCGDDRIGNFYNNPSFGYGGYCLPKDSKQLLANFNNVPNRIIKAVVESNKTRKKFILKSILSKKPKIVGIFRIVMKNGSDNYRESAIIEIIQALKKKKIKIIIYEPSIKNIFFDEVKVINDIDKFIKNSDIILANRNSKILKSAKNKVYTRDLFNRD